MAIFRALFVDDLAIGFCGRSLDTIERHLQQSENAIQEWATRNGFRFAAHKCKVVHFTAPRHKATRPSTITMGDTLLPVEESTKILGLWWDSHLSFKKHSVLKTQCKEALNLIRVVAHLKWGGERDTLLMLYRTIVRSKLDMDVLCMAQHQVPICDNWTASTMLDWDWHLEHFAPAQSPACTRRPTKFLWRKGGWSCPCITIWRLVPALTTQHIMPYMNLTQPQEICIFLNRMEKVAWLDPRPNPLVSR